MLDSCDLCGLPLPPAMDFECCGRTYRARHKPRRAPRPLPRLAASCSCGRFTDSMLVGLGWPFDDSRGVRHRPQACWAANGAQVHNTKGE